MKISTLIVLCLLVVGFFACTSDAHPATTDVTLQTDDNTLRAADFAEFTEVMVMFGLLTPAADPAEQEYGSEDVRLYRDEEGAFTLDFLTNDSFDSKESIADVLARRPDRPWDSALVIPLEESAAPRLEEWLANNFTGNLHTDLRVTIYPEGKVAFMGRRTLGEELVAFPAVSFFE